MSLVNEESNVDRQITCAPLLKDRGGRGAPAQPRQKTVLRRKLEFI